MLRLLISASLAARRLVYFGGQRLKERNALYKMSLHNACLQAAGNSVGACLPDLGSPYDVTSRQALQHAVFCS
jgi:hypothetical protein